MDVTKILPPPTNQATILVSHQNTDDIINHMLIVHNHFKNDYDKLVPVFEDLTNEELYNFCKKYFIYKADSETFQDLKSPSYMLHNRIVDCKSYTLFINGIKDAINRLHNNCNTIEYVFVSYDDNPQPTHVFARIDGQVIDPCRKRYNSTDYPTFENAIKINPMVRMIAGLNPAIIGDYGDPGDEGDIDYTQEDYSELTPVLQDGDPTGANDPSASNDAMMNNLNKYGSITKDPATGQVMADKIDIAKNVALASAGDPGAIAKLASDPGKLIDVAKDILTMKDARETYKALSKSGVNSSFFQRFPFLNFLDNSTNHWKSRAGLLDGKSPVERISWYMNGVNKGDLGWDDLIQYAGLYGNEPGGDKRSNDNASIPYAVAKLYNQLIYNILHKNDPNFDVYGSDYVTKRIMMDLTKTPDYAQKMKLEKQTKTFQDFLNDIVKNPNKYKDNGTSQAGMSPVVTLALVGAAGYAIYSQLKK